MWFGVHSWGHMVLSCWLLFCGLFQHFITVHVLAMIPTSGCWIITFLPLLPDTHLEIHQAFPNPTTEQAYLGHWCQEAMLIPCSSCFFLSLQPNPNCAHFQMALHGINARASPKVIQCSTRSEGLFAHQNISILFIQFFLTSRGFMP